MRSTDERNANRVTTDRYRKVLDEFEELKHDHNKYIKAVEQPQNVDTLTLANAINYLNYSPKAAKVEEMNEMVKYIKRLQQAMRLADEQEREAINDEIVNMQKQVINIYKGE